MPANLSPEYIKAEERYAHAKSLEERIEITEELIRLAPKHKGTEKLLKMLKQRLAKLRREFKDKEAKRSGRSVQSFAVRKEGAAQVVLLGLPNSGKSTVLHKLTAARPTVASYPFTTLTPEPGMMEVGGVQIQLVEAPGVVEGAVEGRGLGVKPLSLARTADAIALVVDASQNPVRELETLLREISRGGIKLNRRPLGIRVERKSTGGVEVSGAELVDGGEDAVREVLRNHGIFNATVVIQEPVSVEEFEEFVEGTTVYKKAFVLVTKCDVGIEENIQRLRERFGELFEIIPVSDEFVKEKIYSVLDLVKVYTKPPDGPPAERPLVVKRGATILEVARAVHKDFARRLKFARVWGSTKFPGQQVPRDYQVQDGDVVELHT